MPIDYSRYPENWKELSLQIRSERAQWKCEWCGAEQGKPHPITGRKVVLTVHHVGIPKPDGTPGDRHDKMDIRPDNLAALCQRCHWCADLDIHMEKAKIAREKRKAEKLSATGQLIMWEVSQ